MILLISIFGIQELFSTLRPQGSEYKILAEELLNEAKKEFELIRGVSLRQVNLEVVSKDWVIENWGKGYADPEIESILREEKVYKALFMIPQDANLYEARLEWTGVFSAAVWQGKIYIVEENFDPTDDFGAKSTFIHEQTHIMQGTLSIPTTSTTFDGEKARAALIEGDATFMADTFKNQEVTPTCSSKASSEPLLLVSMLNLFSDEIYLSLPDTISAFNWFPYDYGVDFVSELHQMGGWSAVNQAYENPPTTTEQVLHPEKYLSQEVAETVEMPSLPGDWVKIKDERFGEYFIFIMLENWISETEAEQAAEGWGGDSFAYYEKEAEYAFTWNIFWDSKDDAHEFYIAFQKMMYETSAEKENCTHWYANGRYVSITWNENSTLITSSTDETLVKQPFSG